MLGSFQIPPRSEDRPELMSYPGFTFSVLQPSKLAHFLQVTLDALAVQAEAALLRDVVSGEPAIPDHKKLVGRLDEAVMLLGDGAFFRLHLIPRLDDPLDFFNDTVFVLDDVIGHVPANHLMLVLGHDRDGVDVRPLFTFSPVHKDMPCGGDGSATAPFALGSSVVGGFVGVVQVDEADHLVLSDSI